MYAFEGVPDVVAPIVLNRSFCGLPCARAFLLETMATFETAWVGTVVGDAEAVAAALRVIYFHAAAERGPDFGPPHGGAG